MLRHHHTDLTVLLETLQPSSLLLIDPDPEALPRDWQTQNPQCQVQRLHADSLGELAQLGCYDLGIVANTLEHLPTQEATRLLARLRDLNTRRFVALVPLGTDWPDHHSHWQTSQLLAYGMVMMARYQDQGKALTLFHYNIRTYKTTPEWFNARNWAHPENWQP